MPLVRCKGSADFGFGGEESIVICSGKGLVRGDFG